MDSLEDRAATLWADLSVAAREPLDVAEIVGLLDVVARGAGSPEAARRLGPAHAVVRLAAAVVAGRHRTDPEAAALAVVVGAYLAEPALSDRWFGYSLGGAEAAAFAAPARRAFSADLVAFLPRDGGR